MAGQGLCNIVVRISFLWWRCRCGSIKMMQMLPLVVLLLQL
jgi:hypothetical protein